MQMPAPGYKWSETPALNRGLGVARGALLARMDADDIALPERLARQVTFLDTYPDVGLLGTAAHEFSEQGEVLCTVTPPADDVTLRRLLIRRNPFVHTSVMFRRDVLDAVGVYDEGFAVAQDYDLWLRMTRVTRLANLTEPLVLRRRAVPIRANRAKNATSSWSSSCWLTSAWSDFPMPVNRP